MVCQGSVVNPFKDYISILKRDWKLLAGLNALYFCVIVIGATIALMSPSLHLSMIQYIGAETIAGPSGANPPANTMQALIMAGTAFASSFFVNTLGMITVPSIILPIWAPIIGAARFFIWGVAYVSPLEGVLTPGTLIPQYVAMLLEGEAYVIAIFACVRQLTVALASADLGFRRALKEYIKAVFDNVKLLVIVALLLATAALYQALLVPVLNGFL
jgi:hypothetical protein